MDTIINIPSAIFSSAISCFWLKFATIQPDEQLSPLIELSLEFVVEESLHRRDPY